MHKGTLAGSQGLCDTLEVCVCPTTTSTSNSESHLEAAMGHALKRRPNSYCTLNKIDIRELESKHMGELWDLFLASIIHSITLGTFVPILKKPKKKKEKISSGVLRLLEEVLKRNVLK